MDIYSVSLALGGIGLGVMGLAGVGRHGAHAQHGGHVHAHVHAHAQHGAHAHAVQHAQGGARPARTAGAARGGGSLGVLRWTLSTPAFIFATLLGFGAAGMLLRGLLSGVVLAVVALVLGLAFERLAIRPLMNLLMGFASAPALTLESTLFDEARAACGFDANGEGLVAVDVDGQVVQVLGTLRPEDRALGVRVHAGDRLRIEDVDGERHRCTVSVIGRP
jgi:hypothetical protein